MSEEKKPTSYLKLQNITLQEAYDVDMSIGLDFKSETNERMRFGSIVLERNASGLSDVAAVLRNLAYQVEVEWLRRRQANQE